MTPQLTVPRVIVLTRLENRQPGYITRKLFVSYTYMQFGREVPVLKPKAPHLAIMMVTARSYQPRYLTS